MQKEIFQDAIDRINKVSHRPEMTRYKKQVNAAKLTILYRGLCRTCPFFEVKIERDGVGLICNNEKPHDPVAMQQAVRIWETPKCEDFPKRE